MRRAMHSVHPHDVAAMQPMQPRCTRSPGDVARCSRFTRTTSLARCTDGSQMHAVHRTTSLDALDASTRRRCTDALDASLDALDSSPRRRCTDAVDASLDALDSSPRFVGGEPVDRHDGPELVEAWRAARAAGTLQGHGVVRRRRDDRAARRRRDGGRRALRALQIQRAPQAHLCGWLGASPNFGRGPEHGERRAARCPVPVAAPTDPALPPVAWPTTITITAPEDAPPASAPAALAPTA